MNSSRLQRKDSERERLDGFQNGSSDRVPPLRDLDAVALLVVVDEVGLDQFGDVAVIEFQIERANAFRGDGLQRGPLLALRDGLREVRQRQVAMVREVREGEAPALVGQRGEYLVSRLHVAHTGTSRDVPLILFHSRLVGAVARWSQTTGPAGSGAFSAGSHSPEGHRTLSFRGGLAHGVSYLRLYFELTPVTELRYLPAADDVTEFQATVTEATDDYLVLDGTYFYPEGGGQPADHGTIEWDAGRATVVDARKNHGDVRHRIGDLEGALPDPGTAVTGHVDEARRDRLRRMHSAQHVVSRVVLDEFEAGTAGNQIHADRSRIDFAPADFEAADLEQIESAANDVVDADLSVKKAERPRDEVEAAVTPGRSQLDLIPESVDPLRVVEMGDFDMCPCGGTHVDRTGDIGYIRITDRVSKGADTERIEFEVCRPEL